MNEPTEIECEKAIELLLGTRVQITGEQIIRAQAILDEKAQIIFKKRGWKSPEQVHGLLENLRERSVRLLKDKCFCIAGGTCPPCAEAEEIRALLLVEEK